MDGFCFKIQTVSNNSVNSKQLSTNVDKNQTRVPDFRKEWKSLAKILRLVGHFPVRIEGKPEIQTAGYERNVTYKFSVLSWIFVCTVLFGLIRVLILIREYAESEKYYGANLALTGLEFHVSRIYKASVPILNTIEWFCVIWTAPLFASFLNTWEKFNVQMGEVVSDLKTKSKEPFCQNKLLRLNKGVIFCLLFPVMFIQIAFLGNRILNDSPSRMSIYSDIFYKILIQFLTTLEETKIILMFQTLSAAFRQVRKCGVEQLIREYNEKMLEENVLSTKRIRKLLNTLKIVRDQVKLVADCQSFHQIIFYIYITIFVSFFLFIEFCIALANKSSYYRMGYDAGMTAVHMFRIFLKGYSAEQITIEEQKIVKVLAEWDLTDSTSDIKLEVKHLIDYLSDHPSKITYSGLICLDRKLVLSVSMQIITYLIVLMQFR